MNSVKPFIVMVHTYTEKGIKNNKNMILSPHNCTIEQKIIVWKRLHNVLVISRRRSKRKNALHSSSGISSVGISQMLNFPAVKKVSWRMADKTEQRFQLRV